MMMMMVRAAGSEMITLIAGPEQEKLVVHKKLLIDSCDFYKAALGTGFKEVKEGIVRHPDARLLAVDSFVSFLYRRLTSVEGAGTISQHRLLAAYGFAESIDAVSMADSIMDAMLPTWRVPRFGDLLAYWNEAPKDAKMKGMLVGKIADRIVRAAKKKPAWKLHRNYFADAQDQPVPVDFLVLLQAQQQVLARIIDLKDGSLKRSGSIKSCDFHLHAANEICLSESLISEFYQ